MVSEILEFLYLYSIEILAPNFFLVITSSDFDIREILNSRKLFLICFVLEDF